MTTITIETKITYKYLMSKSKDWLATEYLRLLDQLDKETLPCGHHKDAIVGNGFIQWCVACEKEKTPD